MGIKFYCPNGHKLNVKTFLAGKRGVCPHCDASVIIPLESQIPSRKKRARATTQPTPAVDKTAMAANRAGSMAGFAGQEFSGPEFSGPEFSGPEFSGPEFSVPQSSGPPYSGQQSDGNAGSAPGRNGSAVAYAPAPFAAPTHAGATAVAGVQPPGPMSSGGNPAGFVTAPVAHVSAIPSGTAVVGVARSGWDPVAEAPQAVWFVRPPSGGQFGPARGEIMRKWVAEGRVTADSMVWREGWTDWREAGPVFPELPAPPALDQAMDFPGPTTLPRPSNAESTASRLPPHSRRRKSPAMAIATVIVLVLVSLGLLITLVYVLGNG